MRKVTSVLNSPAKIAGFGIVAIVLICALIFATINVGAGVNANKVIGMDKGVNVALQDAGFKAEEVTNLIASYDTEDGAAAYEVDFTAGGYEYDYLIKASDGTILEAQREAVKVKEPAPAKEETPEPAKEPTPSKDPEPVKDPEPAKETPKQEPAKEPAKQETPKKETKPTSDYIGVDKAKAIAREDAGVSASAATFVKAKLDREDGIMVYEIEFYTSDKEFEYEINATSGKIRDKDVEFFERDDWDDRWDD